MAAHQGNTSPAAVLRPKHSVRVALYARVSTLDKGQDPELQLSECREYSSRRGFTIHQEYVDRVSGTRESRPALDRMMADARRRKFDALLCWKLDRFSRSLKHLVNTVDELAGLGVAFIALRDNLDLSTASGRLMVHVISAMAQFERELTAERVRAGLKHARAKGKRLGRPRANLSVSRIAALRSAGASWRTIARTMNCGTATVLRYADVAYSKSC